jgi:hypothetical protein
VFLDWGSYRIPSTNGLWTPMTPDWFQIDIEELIKLDILHSCGKFLSGASLPGLIGKGRWGHDESSWKKGPHVVEGYC